MGPCISNQEGPSSVPYKLFGPQDHLGTYDTLDEATAAASSNYAEGAPLEWRNPKPGRHELWYLHKDEKLLVDAHYRVIEED
jgi:hypothetical protein